MTPHACSRETDLCDAIAGGTWPEAAGQELRAHVDACPVCRDIALVATSLHVDERALRNEAAPPSSAVVWWRAQMRARQEAARAADRPITIVQALAIACTAGLLLGLAGWLVTWIRSAGWLGDASAAALMATTRVAAADVSSRWVVLPLLMVLIVIAPIALYAILVDD